MAEELKEVREPFFSLLSFLRLADRGSEAQRLADAAIRLQDSWDLLPWAVDDICGWALFQSYQEFVRAGANDEAFDRYWQKCLDLGVKDTKEAREHHRQFGLHLAGLAGKRWTRQEFLSTKKRIGIKLNLLLVDYEHWLCTARHVPAIVADEFRLILWEALHGMKKTMSRDSCTACSGRSLSRIWPTSWASCRWTAFTCRQALLRCTTFTISWPRPSWSTRRSASRRSRSAWTSGTRSRPCSMKSCANGGRTSSSNNTRRGRTDDGFACAVADPGMPELLERPAARWRTVPHRIAVK